jgi:hypothetical protein
MQRVADCWIEFALATGALPVGLERKELGWRAAAADQHHHLRRTAKANVPGSGAPRP